MDIDPQKLYSILADMDIEERGTYILKACMNMKIGLVDQYEWINKQPSLVIEKKARKPRANKGDYSECFLKFWEAYPEGRKTAKGEAYKSWKRIREDEEQLLELCLEAIVWQRNTRSWQEGYIPMPATYLNQRRWEDEQPKQHNAVMGIAPSKTGRTMVL